MISEHIEKKHLSYEEREYIEIGLNKGRKFSEIARSLNKDRTTIYREVIKHRFKKVPGGFNNSGNMCVHRQECKKFDCTSKLKCYQTDICYKITSNPYVCNGCELKSKCRKIKYYYYSKFAYDEYKEKLSINRNGINLSKSEVYEIDKLVAPLIKQNQSINHIYANHPDELPFSKQTLYTYIDLGVFSFRNIDLIRKVKYKPRKNTEKQRVRRETAIRKGRTYKEFQEYIDKNSNLSIVEMDTVEGVKGGKVFLTLLFRNSNFMLIYLLERKTCECVERVFNDLKDTLGIELFKKMFGVILTDNGSEFFNPTSIELSKDSTEVLTHVFYCDPGASWQKGAIEKNHEYIRYVLPKGSCFDNLTQEDVTKLTNHINSTCREKLNNKTPYDAITLLIDEKVLVSKIKLKKIVADSVNLSPSLLKKG